MFNSLSNLVFLSLLSMDCTFAAGSRVFRRSGSLNPNSAIVQLFEWNWNSVAAECSFLASAGYGYVQVSPASEHINGSQWWTDYQTVSYKMTSKRGTSDQFSSMVSTCAGAGVGIIVDVVFNHMTSGSGIGFAGSSYSKYNYPAVPYTPSNFHYCNGGTSASNINNYNNAYNVQFCELVGLADLAQEQPAVQALIAAYLNKLLSMGVAGFRIDAAKHMVDADLASIFKQLNYPFYDTQEVIYGQGEAVQPSQYTSTGSVIEFRAPSTVKTYFTGSPGIAALVTPTPMGAAWGFVDSSVANYIMANQDTERGGTSLNYQSGPAYILSGIFMLGFNYGCPTVYSGYNFSSYDDGAPQTSGYTNAVTCGSNNWRCEHRFPALVNMVQFHNAVGSSPLTNIQQGSIQQIAFGRGSIGFLIINNDAVPWTSTWKTSLPAGTYCDIIHDTTIDPTVCNGPSYVVSNSGTFSASVGAHDALALFTAATGTNTSTPPTTTTTSAPASTAVSITFDVTVTSLSNGDVVKVAGSIAQLGTWAPAAALPLSQSANTEWRFTVTLPFGTYFEYKYIRVSSNGVVTWESGSNRVYTTPSTGGLSVVLYGTFGSTTSATSVVTQTVATTTLSSSSFSSAGGPSSSSVSTFTSSSAPASSPPINFSAVSSTSTAKSTTSMSSSPPASSSATVTSSPPVSSSTSSSSPPPASSSATVIPSTVTTSPTPSSTAVAVTFVETASTGTGDVIKIAGSISQLGSWAPGAAIPLTQPSLNADWRVTISLPPGINFQYKFIRVSNSGTVTWESGSNRVYTTPPTVGSYVTLYGIFGSTTSSTSAVTAGATTVPTTTTTQSPPVSTGASVTFSESATTSSGEVVKLVGSIGQLGNWAPASAIGLYNTNSNSVWSVTLALPPNTAFQYKFIRVKSGSVVWESDPNRFYTTLGQGSSVTLTSSFR
ncbi:glycoside hydrolase superfamily [Mycena galericulata]|nr:glycoside hydrolase superfamily [Mycena galericulata]